jgi:hypothetical protein
MTKILYSPGFGAGWSTWSDDSDEQTKFMLTFEPLIEAIEKGEDVGHIDAFVRWDDFKDENGKHDQLAYFRAQCVPDSPLDKFVIECWRRFKDVPHIGGARGLAVDEVYGPFRIDEYDGFESIEYDRPNFFIDPDKL